MTSPAATFNLLTPCVQNDFIYTQKNLQLKATCLFKYVWPSSGHKALKGWEKFEKKIHSKLEKAFRAKPHSSQVIRQVHVQIYQ